jgi:hypothetical protein
MRDQDLHLQSAISQLQSVDESMKLFGLKIDRAFVTKIIMTLLAAVVSRSWLVSHCWLARCCSCCSFTRARLVRGWCLGAHRAVV